MKKETFAAEKMHFEPSCSGFTKIYRTPLQDVLLADLNLFQKFYYCWLLRQAKRFRYSSYGELCFSMPASQQARLLHVSENRISKAKQALIDIGLLAIDADKDPYHADWLYPRNFSAMDRFDVFAERDRETHIGSQISFVPLFEDNDRREEATLNRARYFVLTDEYLSLTDGDLDIEDLIVYAMLKDKEQAVQHCEISADGPVVVWEGSDFAVELGISTKTLSRRLNKLAAHGVVSMLRSGAGMKEYHILLHDPLHPLSVSVPIPELELMPQDQGRSFVVDEEQLRKDIMDVLMEMEEESDEGPDLNMPAVDNIASRERTTLRDIEKPDRPLPLKRERDSLNNSHLQNPFIRLLCICEIFRKMSPGFESVSCMCVGSGAGLILLFSEGLWILIGFSGSRVFLLLFPVPVRGSPHEVIAWLQSFNNMCYSYVLRHDQRLWVWLRKRKELNGSTLRSSSGCLPSIWGTSERGPESSRFWCFSSMSRYSFSCPAA